MSTALAIAFLLAMLVWRAVLRGRIVFRWNRGHPAMRATYALRAPRSYHLRVGRLFVAVIARPL